MPDFRNTSYDQEYIVVSRSTGQVVLRPTNEALLNTYWKEFVSADIVRPKVESLYLKLQSLPATVRKLDANTPYALDYPQVLLVQGDKEFDLSRMVSANKPSTQTPGLYVIEYVLPLPGFESNVVWKSYVSVEEPPVLRQTIAPWNRSSYTIENLTRLVLEPQFQEALYEEGAPLYNFVTANMSPALRPSSARECFQCIGYKSGDRLFISGHRLPLSTTVELDVGPGSSFDVHLDRNVSATAWKAVSYAEGSVVQNNKRLFCNVQKTTAQDVPGSSKKWIEGGFYSLQEAVPPGGASAESAEMRATAYYRWTHARDGAVELLAVWAPVDLRGYIFAVDVKHAPALGTYWGYYDRRYFEDYRPGDIVSYISEGVLYLYRRNDTDIRDLSAEESYRPGHFQNPHWDEAYSEWEASQLRAVGKWIRPITNASNAIVAKTCSLSEEVCTIYAYTLGIPDSIVDAIGSKCSVFLYILLQRTRNTFEGFRNAFRAIGLDVSDLHKVYDTTPAAGENGATFEGVYPAADTLKHISAAIHADLLWQPDAGADSDEAPPPLSAEDVAAGRHWIRYWPNPRHAGAYYGRTQYQIQEYRGASWKTIYELKGFGDDQRQKAAQYRVKGNNRYYRASLSLLDRLATQALVEMGDSRQWIDLNSFSEISYWLADVMLYEVPMYIYLTLTVNIASIDEAWLAGRGMRRLHMAAYGGTPTMVVHPSLYFDLASATTKAIQAQVQVWEDEQWVDVEPTSERAGSAVYDFDHSVTVRFLFDADFEVDGYWTSRYTLGALGDNSEPPVDASQMPNAKELHLMNGIVGVTPLCPDGSLVGELSYLRYNYILSNDGDPWKLDGTTPFGEYRDADEDPEIIATWMSPLNALIDAITRVADKDGNSLRYRVQGIGTRVLLEVFGGTPEEIYIYGQYDRLIVLIRMPELRYVVQPQDAFDSTGEQPIYRILIDKG